MRATWNLTCAREMHAAGTSYRDIGRHFATDATTVRMRLDPEYAASRRAKANECRRSNTAKAAAAKHETDRESRKTYKEVSAAKRDAGITYSHSGAKLEAEWRRQLETMPKHDTRSLTGRLMGDPLPTRSALDMRKQQETRI
jgi:transposase InsO family protein